MDIKILKPGLLRDLYAEGKTPANIERLAWLIVKSHRKALSKFNPGLTLNNWLEMTKHNLYNLPLQEIIEQAIWITKENSTLSSTDQVKVTVGRSRSKSGMAKAIRR